MNQPREENSFGLYPLIFHLNFNNSYTVSDYKFDTKKEADSSEFNNRIYTPICNFLGVETDVLEPIQLSKPLEEFSKYSFYFE